MNKQANDNKPHDEGTEQFKERIRRCKTIDGIFALIVGTIGVGSYSHALIRNQETMKEQITKVMSTRS